MKYLFILSCLFIPLLSFCQNISYGGKQYKSTITMNFPLTVEPHFYGTTLEVTIAKNGKAGFLLLANESMIPETYLGGTVTIFLEDGREIKCLDKGIRDAYDNKSVALYFLSEKEILMLEDRAISKIRFNIKQPSPSGYTTLSYTANNYDKEKSAGSDNYPTDILVTAIGVEW